MNKNPKMKLNMINEGLNETCKEKNKRANEIAQLKDLKETRYEKKYYFY